MRQTAEAIEDLPRHTGMMGKVLEDELPLLQPCLDPTKPAWLSARTFLQRLRALLPLGDMLPEAFHTGLCCCGAAQLFEQRIEGLLCDLRPRYAITLREERFHRHLKRLGFSRFFRRYA